MIFIQFFLLFQSCGASVENLHSPLIFGEALKMEFIPNQNGKLSPKIPYFEEVQSIVKFLLKDPLLNCYLFVGGVLSYFFKESPAYLNNLEPAKFKKTILLNFSLVNILEENQLLECLTMKQMQFSANDFKCLIQKLNVAYDGELLHIANKFKTGPHLFVIFWFLEIFKLETHLKVLQDLGREKGWCVVDGKNGEPSRNLDFKLLLEKFRYNRKYREVRE